jgi:hypothetical protein
MPILAFPLPWDLTLIWLDFQDLGAPYLSMDPFLTHSIPPYLYHLWSKSWMILQEKMKMCEGNATGAETHR